MAKVQIIRVTEYGKGQPIEYDAVAFQELEETPEAALDLLCRFDGVCPSGKPEERIVVSFGHQFQAGEIVTEQGVEPPTALAFGRALPWPDGPAESVATGDDHAVRIRVVSAEPNDPSRPYAEQFVTLEISAGTPAEAQEMLHRHEGVEHVRFADRLYAITNAPVFSAGDILEERKSSLPPHPSC